MTGGPGIPPCSQPRGYPSAWSPTSLSDPRRKSLFSFAPGELNLVLRPILLFSFAALYGGRTAVVIWARRHLA